MYIEQEKKTLHSEPIRQKRWGLFTPRESDNERKSDRTHNYIAFNEC